MTLPGPLIAVVGPTASGKSAVAELVAERLGSAVVSVDAMQVYRGMDIGTAKTPECARRAPLLMVDVCDPSEDYSAQRFQADARACVDRLLAQKKTPVLAGGTGLYLDAVVDRMEFPAGDKGGDARRRYEEYLERNGAEALHALLRERDPRAAAAIHPHNARRVVRALEMADDGVSYADQADGFAARERVYDVRVFGLSLDRARLYARIEARVDAMFEAGLVDEVSALVKKGLDAGRTAGQAIGYKEVLAALKGDCTLDEARAAMKQRTRRYAKRQLSWFRRDPHVRWLDMDALTPRDAAQAILEDHGAL